MVHSNAVMGAWGGERSVVGAWKSARWVELALDARVAPLAFYPGGRGRGVEQQGRRGDPDEASLQ